MVLSWLEVYVDVSVAGIVAPGGSITAQWGPVSATSGFISEDGM
jgi:hypothetical protein